MPAGEFVVYRDTVTLYSSHIDVDIRVTGLPAPQEAAALMGLETRAEGDMPIRLRIENSNAQTSFNNEINESEKGTIYPELSYDEETGAYRTADDFCLFRMDAGGELDADLCAHTLVLETADGEELVRGSIYDYLRRYEDEIDVTKQEALLPIEINFTQTNVEITLPQWYIEDIIPGWE